jgi:hypothetical protein
MNIITHIEGNPFIRGPLTLSRYWKGFAIVRDWGWKTGATFGYWPRKQWAIYQIKQQPFYC